MQLIWVSHNTWLSNFNEKQTADDCHNMQQLPQLLITQQYTQPLYACRPALDSYKEVVGANCYCLLPLLKTMSELPTLSPYHTISTPSLLWRPGVVDWSGGVFARCMPWVQLYVNACNGWPQFALQHHWLLPINCHFLRLYSAAGCGIAAVSSAIEESDLYLFYHYFSISLTGLHFWSHSKLDMTPNAEHLRMTFVLVRSLSCHVEAVND